MTARQDRTGDRIIITGVTRTDDTLYTTTASGSGPFQADVTRSRSFKSPLEDKAAEAAIYSYLQGLRALGRTRVDSSEIAHALGLEERVVNRILERLGDRGVTPSRSRWR